MTQLRPTHADGSHPQTFGLKPELVFMLAPSPTGIARIIIFLEPDLFGRFGLLEGAAARAGGKPLPLCRGNAS
jgi:hypothetical protein